MKIYLDVDGTLLTKQGELAPYALEFLMYVVENFDTYWLTTRCKGDSTEMMRHLKTKFPIAAHPFLEKIQETDWDVLKTDAIDFKEDFRWFDDYVMDAEIAVLEKHGCLDNLIKIDLINDPNQLKKVILQLKGSKD